MQKMTMNVLLSLIIQSKITGRGMTSNGRLYVMLMEIIADHDNRSKTAEESILNKFNNEVTHHESYRKLERFLSRFVHTGKGYPYELFSFDKLENSTDYREFILAMKGFTDAVIDKEKLESLVYTLIEILRQDTSITTIMYGHKFIPKERLFGSFAHPNKICAEALLLGLLYHVHINPDTAECVELLEVPEKRSFKVIRYCGESSLNTDMPVNLIENIHETASRQKPATMKYQLELSDGSELPHNQNIFLYGSGGAGKTTFLRSLMGRNNTVDFYFPLYRYKYEVHDDFSGECCYILLQILLKYHYQYEYDNYNALIANEGKSAVLHQLKELDRLMKSTPVNGQPAYTLLLDGVNEMSVNLQVLLTDEIEMICRDWKNVRIIITGRTIPKYTVFKSFFQTEILGVSGKLLREILSENNAVPDNDKMLEILKKPLFLNMYLKNNGISGTRAELLDSYIMNWKGSVAERFMLQYSLPLACKKMLEEFPEYEITRGDLLEVIDKSIKIYVKDEYVYQDYVFPRNINKKELLASRENDEWLELLINNTGLLTVSEHDAKYLKFVHQYYQEYFAAKHIINGINIFQRGCKTAESEKEYFAEIGISEVWFDYFRKFPDKKDIYTLVGELCGEYLNDAETNEEREKNLLDKYLDICRMYDVKYSTENVFMVMKMMHGGTLWSMDFSNLTLPMKIYADYKFNLNGEYPCLFLNCTVFQVEESEDDTDRFRDSDFYNATFFDMETKEKVSKMGGICDFEDDKFIDSLRREMILTWSDIWDRT